jgi:hypothetical protein
MQARGCVNGAGLPARGEKGQMSISVCTIVATRNVLLERGRCGAECLKALEGPANRRFFETARDETRRERRSSRHYGRSARS